MGQQHILTDSCRILALVSCCFLIYGAAVAADYDCDVNDDGAVNATDVQLVINAVLGIDLGEWNPDVNDDGIIDATDVQVVINAALGISPNSSPELSPIGNKQVDEGQTLEFTVTATDPDEGDTLTFSAGNLPPGADFNADTQAFSWTPAFGDSGSYQDVLFTVTDEGDPPLSDSATITITVGDVNRPPGLSPIGDKQVDEGVLLEFAVTGTDPDAGDALVFSASNLPPGASFDGDTQTFSWMSVFGDAGSYQDVLFSVTDDGTPALTDSETITITVGDVNRPPELNPIGNKQVEEDQSLEFVVTATDPDEDALTFSASNLPPNASFDVETLTFTWTPAYGDAGSYQDVLFAVTDNGDPLLSDSETITITVGDVNRPPELNPIGDKQVDEGQTLEFVVSATDPDSGDKLTYSARNLPSGASFSLDWTFTWTPAFGKDGSYQDILFTVTDNGNPPLSDSETITITVGDVNRPPELNPVGDKQVDEGETLEFTVTATDPDSGDALSYSANNLPPGASFNTDTQTFAWTPTFGDAESYQDVLFTVRDNGGPLLSDSETIAITVNAVEPPAITLHPFSQAVDPDTTVTFTLEATGAMPLSYQWTKDGEAIQEATSPTYTIDSVQQFDEGSYACTVTNGAGVATSNTAILTLNIETVGPVPAFAAVPTFGIVPLAIEFTDESYPGDEIISEWNWDFGDGFGSNEQDPLYTYQNPGIYTVSLTISTETSGDYNETKFDYITVMEGNSNIIGAEGGSVTTEEGGAIEILPEVLLEDLEFRATETDDSIIRDTLHDDVPYSGSFTVEAFGFDEPAAKEEPGATFISTITVPIWNALEPGTELDVYKKIDFPLYWMRLDVKAVVNEDGVTASFEASDIGTYLVREFDEYSIPTIRLDSDEKKAQKGYEPEVGYGLHKVENGGTGKIPIILIHGAGSHMQTQQEGQAEESGKIYARWDNFIAWAQGGGLDLENTYQLWWFLHDTSKPVGYYQGPFTPIHVNNVWELANELEVKRARTEDPFPNETQQFIIVAHSRGGLVTRAFMEKWPSGGDQVLMALTLATPHHGSPLAVPDWTFHTLSRGFDTRRYTAEFLYSLVRDNFNSEEPGSTDLAWDNFDGAPYRIYGIPPEDFRVKVVSELGSTTEYHTLTRNDGGLPYHSNVQDNDMHIPSAQDYPSLYNVYGRRQGTTLWDINYDAFGEWKGQYLDKFLLYGGYDPSFIVKENLKENEALYALSRVMGFHQSSNQEVSHFEANDGMVPLQSALCLSGSVLEPIYATGKRFRMFPYIKKPLVFDNLKTRLQVPANHVRYTEFNGYNHLDMVVGRKSNLFSEDDTVLFGYISADIGVTAVSTPIASVGVSAKVGATVTIDVSGSHDRDTFLWPLTSLKYRIYWDEGSAPTWTPWDSNPTTQHTYSENRTYKVKLQVRDADGMMSDVAIEEVAIEAPPATVVPNVVGTTQSVAVEVITLVGLTVGDITQQYSATVPAGQVISQNPAASTSVPPGTAVDLVISSGSEPVTVPNVVGTTQSVAEEAIALAGLNVGTIAHQYSASIPAEQVISQDPAANTSVAPGTAVDLVVSAGPEPPIIPDLSIESASVTLSEASPNATVTVTNIGGDTLSWTAESDNPSVTVTPSTFTGNSKEVTISTSDFATSYTAQVTFTNDVDSSNYEVVNVSVTGSGGASDETIMLPGNVPLEMVWIPAGTFMMGRYEGEQDSQSNEDPQHQVTLTQGFWMGKYELTKAQWTAVMGTTPWSGAAYVLDDPDSPAVYVSWNDAQAFVTALNSLTAKTFRLPTEAEWEYACRAGTTTRFYWGDDASYTAIDDYAWGSYNTFPVNEMYAHVNGQKPSNAWGLYDMSGNVYEWCQDWYGSYSSGSVTDPTGGSSGSSRITRGGAWTHSTDSARSAARGAGAPDALAASIGFRVCAVADDVLVDSGVMLSVPAGTFEMGDPWNEWFSYERPVHDVTLSAYEIGKYEVTNQEYADILNWALDTGRLTDTSGDISAYGQVILEVTSSDCQINYSGGQFVVESRDGYRGVYSMEDHPVVKVRWYGAVVYCNWLSEANGLQPCYNTSTWACDFSKSGYHLPTEAQWERAAAWDGSKHYRYGNGSDSISYSNVNYSYTNPLGLLSQPWTSPVGYYSSAASPVGCYDMSGNVWEWCNDWYDSAYYASSPSSDPTGPASGSYRLLRGGSWRNTALYCRSACRYADWPELTPYYIGFRVSRTP